MSVEDNKAGQRRVWEEVFGKGNYSVMPELFAPHYFFRSPLGMDIKGPEGFKQSIAMMRRAFPDLSITIDDMLADGDKVVTRFTLSGTFKGEMMGIAPTGKRVTVTGIVITRWENGKEVEAWESIDTLGYYQQLGITPPTAQPATARG